MPEGTFDVAVYLQLIANSMYAIAMMMADDRGIWKEDQS